MIDELEKMDVDGLRVFRYGLTDSTNKRAREYVADDDAPYTPTLFFADGQTEGRGRLGRSFFSPKETGVYMTLLLKAPKSSEHFTLITSLIAVAASDAIYDTLGIKVSVKWVNDLYLGEKKVAGILAESFVSGEDRYVALGVGINLCTRDFPDDIREKAGSLVRVDDISVDGEKRFELALRLCRGLIEALESEDVSGYIERYRSMSCVIGKRVRYVQNGEEHEGLAVGITDLGALTVELDGGDRVELSSGEISLFIKKETD